jgi:hypothetical protein
MNVKRATYRTVVTEGRFARFSANLKWIKNVKVISKEGWKRVTDFSGYFVEVARFTERLVMSDEKLNSSLRLVPAKSSPD